MSGGRQWYSPAFLTGESLLKQKPKIEWTGLDWTGKIERNLLSLSPGYLTSQESAIKLYLFSMHSDKLTATSVSSAGVGIFWRVSEDGCTYKG